MLRNGSLGYAETPSKGPAAPIPCSAASGSAAAAFVRYGLEDGGKRDHVDEFN